VDQREHVAVIRGKQLPQVRRRRGMHIGLARDRARVRELPVQLHVQLGAVGDHHERTEIQDRCAPVRPVGHSLQQRDIQRAWPL
jgi:hypothetical protein